MNHPSDQFDDMDLDDFEESLAGKPRDETWGPIGGRVVPMMVGARWEHHFIVRNPTFGIDDRPRTKRPGCRPRDRYVTTNLVVSGRSGHDWAKIMRPDAPSAHLDLPAIGVSIPLAEIRRDVPTPGA